MRTFRCWGILELTPDESYLWAVKGIFNQDFVDFIKSLSNAEVRYILVGGYAVVLHGYHRTTGDLDVWVEQTSENYLRLIKAFSEFGIPHSAISLHDFIGNSGLDVFTIGRPPVAIDILTSVKGLSFDQAYASSLELNTGDVIVRMLNLNSLLAAKEASGRHKDLDDIEHLKYDEQ